MLRAAASIAEAHHLDLGQLTRVGTGVLSPCCWLPLRTPPAATTTRNPPAPRRDARTRAASCHRWSTGPHGLTSGAFSPRENYHRRLPTARRRSEALGSCGQAVGYPWALRAGRRTWPTGLRSSVDHLAILRVQERSFPTANSQPRNVSPGLLSHCLVCQLTARLTIAATVMRAAVSHPRTAARRPLVCLPMSLRLPEMSMTRIRNGAAAMPLR